MWLPRENSERRDLGNINTLVAVAIDKDKGSQYALKWVIDNMLHRGQTVVLIHVKTKHLSSSSSSSAYGANTSNLMDAQMKDLFLPFRCFCTRKDIQCKDVILEDPDVAKALIEFVIQSAIEILVMGATKSSFLRFNKTEIPAVVSKAAPDFCTIYVISKGKIQSMRSASRPAPANSPLRAQIMNSRTPTTSVPSSPRCNTTRGSERTPSDSPLLRGNEEMDFRSPFTRGGRYAHVKSYGEISADTDISFVSSARSSVDRLTPSLCDPSDPATLTPTRISTSSLDNMDHILDAYSRRKSIDSASTPPEFSIISSDESSSVSWPSTQLPEDLEAEMKRLKLELKQTMDMYSSACKEALTAKQKAMELQRWKMEEERRYEEARLAEEAALAMAEKEKAKSRAAMEAAEAAQRIAELEAQKRINAEMKALKEAEEKKKAFNKLTHGDVRYRRYTIEEIEVASDYFAESRKIGEGGYGPVYKCYLDHTLVAIKVLRPDAAQGKSQFQQEVEVLSCIRHPHMVLLLGACPEYGCLVYEYMHNGSLEDRLFCRGGTPPLSWQHRFRISAEIATGLLFLHHTKPEPLVHRDLKPANILLDRNLVSKISDVGLARLVPASIADTVTQYRMTSTAGTFCYIDPEYQQTGMLGVKSDVYSLGIMLLQIITAKAPMGLTRLVEHAIENGTFKDMLDPTVPDWPVEEALILARIGLECAELRRKDRPDLGTVVLPELNKLRDLAEESLETKGLTGLEGFPYIPSQVSIRQDVMSGAPPYDSYRSRSSALSDKSVMKSPLHHL